MYYVETRVVFRVEYEALAKELCWLREAIENYLEGQEEVVFIDTLKVTNEEQHKENSYGS